jgi:hypothetical protein
MDKSPYVMAITARPHGIAGIIGIHFRGFTCEALLRIQPLWLSPIYGFHLENGLKLGCIRFLSKMLGVIIF